MLRAYLMTGSLRRKNMKIDAKFSKKCFLLHWNTGRGVSGVSGVPGGLPYKTSCRQTMSAYAW